MNQRTILRTATVGLFLSMATAAFGATSTVATESTSPASRPAGVNGLSGTNGITGVNGLSGINGLYAANGLAGVNGLVGVNGLMGVNGLSDINGLPRLIGFSEISGGWLSNALRPQQGLSVAAGLSTDAGLSNSVGLMATASGQKIASYLVKCALPSDRSIEKLDGKGDVHTFRGSLGVAAEWENGSCSESCQEWMSACLLAHVNLTGRHVSLWFTADHPAVDLTTSTDFPLEEASYFGNLFASSPSAYVCYGRNVSEHPIAGRVCTGARDCPYTDPYALTGGACEGYQACEPGTAPSGERSGYTTCHVGERAFSRVFTSWKR